MDFTTIQGFGPEKNNNSFSRPITIEKKHRTSKFSSAHLVNLSILMNENQDLIQDCLSDKDDTILSSIELKNYSSLALTTAALECKNQKKYRSFAKKRLENMLNGAIAEARLITALKGKKCDNNTVSMEFESIEKMYC